MAQGNTFDAQTTAASNDFAITFQRATLPQLGLLILYTGDHLVVWYLIAFGVIILLYSCYWWWCKREHKKKVKPAKDKDAKFYEGEEDFYVRI